MSRYISENLRLRVAERAKFCCEYCLVHQDDMVFVYQIDHILSLKHDGKTEFSNLAFACSMCNNNKGSDLGTFLPNDNRIVRFFNPRRDRWNEHFELQNAEIVPKTRIGAATVKVLEINQADRLILRQALIEAGRYPFPSN